MTENEIAKIVVHSSFQIHSNLGPGLLESVYESLLAHELKTQGIAFRRQQGIPVRYNGVRIDLGFRADLIVQNKVIIEIKSLEGIAPVHYKQLLTYLRVSDLKLGLLINFGANLIKDGISRMVNNLDESYQGINRR